MLVVLGVPLLHMELTVGQYTRRGPVHALANLCPLLKGTLWRELIFQLTQRDTNKKVCCSF